MGSEGDVVNDSVARVPSAARTRTIKQHCNPELDTGGSGIGAAGAPLVESQNRESGWHNPTVRVRHPWPTELVGIKADVPIGRAKLPFRQPMRFRSGEVHEPPKALQLFRNSFNFVM
jgi:hypothetical protein